MGVMNVLSYVARMRELANDMPECPGGVYDWVAGRSSRDHASELRSLADALESEWQSAMRAEQERLVNGSASSRLIVAGLAERAVEEMTGSRAAPGSAEIEGVQASGSEPGEDGGPGKLRLTPEDVHAVLAAWHQEETVP